MNTLFDSFSSATPPNQEATYVGWVVDNADPLERQRIKVNIPGKLTGPIAALPWVFPQQMSLFGMGDNYGTVRVPAVGSRVLVFFQEGDLALGVYVGDVPTATTTLPPELSENYPNRVGSWTPKGDVWYFDASTGDFFFRTQKGTGVTIKGETGDVAVVVSGNFTQVVKGDYTLQVDGKSTTVVKGDISESSGGDLTQQVSGSKTQTVGGSYTASVSGSRSISCSSEGHSGPIDVVGDVRAVGISLSTHGTSGVKGGSDISGPPV